MQIIVSSVISVLHCCTFQFGFCGVCVGGGGGGLCVCVCVRACVYVCVCVEGV